MFCQHCVRRPTPPARLPESAYPFGPGWFETADYGLTFGGYFWCGRHRDQAIQDKAELDRGVEFTEMLQQADKLYSAWLETQTKEKA